MSRNAVADELARLCLQIQQAATAGEKLASASGGMLNPTYFRAAAQAAVLAAGELDQRGLLAPNNTTDKAAA